VACSFFEPCPRIVFGEEEEELGAVGDCLEGDDCSESEDGKSLVSIGPDPIRVNKLEVQLRARERG
jgi:hypothetical protein